MTKNEKSESEPVPGARQAFGTLDEWGEALGARLRKTVIEMTECAPEPARALFRGVLEDAAGAWSKFVRASALFAGEGGA